MATFNWPSISVTASSAPIQYNRDTIATTVSQDTATASNSRPLPVLPMDTAGNSAGTKLLSTQVLGTDRALITNSVIHGFNTSGGVYVDIKANPSGALTVDATQSGTWNINNISGTVSLPTGAATETTLAAISTKTPALGQALMAASSPVVIASNQSAIPASQSGTWNITNVSGTVSLPTGAATETTLAGASAKLPATLGQKTMAASMAVALASDQSSIPTAASQSGTWNITNVSGTVSLPTGAATAALQTALNAQIPTTLGTKTAAASMSVTLASDQAALPSSRNANATVGASTSVGTTAVTETAPADAVGFCLIAPSSNTGTIYWIQGATATTSNGFEVQAGRSYENIMCAANLSLISDTPAQGYRLVWMRR